VGDQPVEEKVTPPFRKRLPLGSIFLFSLFVLVSTVVFSLWPHPPSVSPPTQELMGVLRPVPKSIMPFNLVDQKKEPFSEEDLHGKWTFLFFGYTSCPDVCPMTLSLLARLYPLLEQELVDDSFKPQVVFVSVDPRRDTPDKLSDYISYFNRGFVAVTGQREEIDNLSGQCGAGYQIGEESGPGEYTVNHTSAIFLIDPRGRLVASFSQPHRAETILRQFVQIHTYMKQR